MVQVFPILTDGIHFFHGSSMPSPSTCRFAYWSRLSWNEWKKKEKPELTKEMAKEIFEKWEQKRY